MRTNIDIDDDLQNEEVVNASELAPWQKQIIDERLNDYYKNPNEVISFDKINDNVENGL